MSEEEDFEEQLLQEKLEADKIKAGDIEHGRTRVDEDGTVFEWDAQKRAWFPKIDADFIAQYQMTYGASATTATTTPTNTASTTAPSVNSTEYYNWYYSSHHYTQSGDTNTIPTDSKAYEEYSKYYEEYYKNYQKENRKNGDESGTGERQEEFSETPGGEKRSFKYYYDYYYDHQYKQTGDPEAAKTYADYWAHYYHSQLQQQEVTAAGDEGEKEEEKKEEKKNGKEEVQQGPKRKAVEDRGWFEMEEEHNTNVYVTGLPADITEDEFREIMNKYGLIMYDPRTRKPKMKLYRDSEGNNKGDGLCCYIKAESVDLALQFLDGSELRNSKISVEKAKFEVKGSYDPKKRKKKLTNKEKNKMKEQQEKLFDWRPDKPKGTRSRHERIIIIQNAFDPMEFERNPLLINEIRDDIRQECSKYGECRKVLVHDRHPAGVIAVTMGQPEEGDLVTTALNGRWFAKRKITAEAWDGKTKYEVKETEAEKEARLKKWQDFLDKGEDESKKKTLPTPSPSSSSRESSSSSSAVPASSSSSDPKPEAPEAGASS